MKTKNQTLLSENTLTSRPTDIIAGFPVRPGLFELNGATPLSNGVNFTAHTRHGTSCELLLFHSGEEEPFAVLPFPNACRIGDVYSMIVMGLDIEDLEYGYHVDGPYEPEKGHIFDKTKVLLDPYAKAVAGQREWGQQKIGSYHARVVRGKICLSPHARSVILSSTNFMFADLHRIRLPVSHIRELLQASKKRSLI